MNPHLKRLAIERQISMKQALYVHENWHDSPGDLWSQPQVRSVLEHTRAFIDDLRGQLSTGASEEAR